MKEFTRPSTIEGMIAFFGTNYFSPKKNMSTQPVKNSQNMVLIKPSSTDEILLFVKETESVTTEMLNDKLNSAYSFVEDSDNGEGWDDHRNK